MSVDRWTILVYNQSQLSLLYFRARLIKSSTTLFGWGYDAVFTCVGGGLDDFIFKVTLHNSWDGFPVKIYTI